MVNFAIARLVFPLKKILHWHQFADVPVLALMIALIYLEIQEARI